MAKRKADPKLVASRLVKLRGIRTRTGVHEETGISYSLLSKYERGERTPSAKNQRKLAEYYGVSTDALFYTID